MLFFHVPWYIIYIIIGTWQILFILGCLKLRKANKDFRSGTQLLASGLIVISLTIFDVLRNILHLEFGIYSFSYIPLIITLLQLTALGVFFIIVGAKNKQLEGKWLLRAGFIYCIASTISIYIYLYLILNCVNLYGESILFYVCLADSYSGGLAYLQLISISLTLVSNLLFLIFSKKLQQKSILYAATILFCSYLFFFINETLPGTLNWFTY